MGTFLSVDGDGRTLAFGQQRGIVLRGINSNNIGGLDLNSGQQPPWQPPDCTNQLCDESDYALMSSWGANHIRWGMSAQWLAQSQFFDVLRQHVEWARANRMFLLPVCFVPPGGSSGGFAGQQEFWNDPANWEALAAFWATVGTEFRDEPVIAAWDILNEPQPGGLDQWTAVAQIVYEALRTVDPNHLVAIQAAGDPNELPSPIVAPGTVLWSSHVYAPVGTSGGNFPGPDPRHPPRWPFWVGEFGSLRPNVDPVPGNCANFDGQQVHGCFFIIREGTAHEGYGIFAGEEPGSRADEWIEMRNAVAAWTGPSIQPDFEATAGQYTVHAADDRILSTTDDVDAACAASQDVGGYVTVCDNRSGVSISEPMSVTPVAAAVPATFTATAGIRNAGTEPITLLNVALAGRPPGGDKVGGPFVNFDGDLTDVTLDAFAELSLRGTLTVPAEGPPGDWTGFVTWKTTDGVWHNNGPDDPAVTFVALAAAVPQQQVLEVALTDPQTGARGIAEVVLQPSGA